MKWRKKFLFCCAVFLFLARNETIAADESSYQADAFFATEKLIFVLEENRQEITREEILQWVEINPKLVFSSTQKSEIANIYFCPLDRLLCRLTKSVREQAWVAKKTDIAVNRDLIRVFVSDLARQYDKDAIDAKFVIEDGRVTTFSSSKEGVKTDIEKNVALIGDFLEKKSPAISGEQEIKLFYRKTKPAIEEKNANNLGIHALIGEGRSNFRGSPKNRIFNIKVATARFNGVLIKPEEEFSFVKILGPVDGEHGYLPELVIKKDKTEPEFGGGICQVSTTAFRAAVYSGLKITARRNHAYPVKYYNPQGMDATVYVPRPDLRFVNNTSGHILIQTRIEGMELIFSFYGSDDGRKIEIDGPKILEQKSDGAMKTAFTQKVFEKNGNQLINDVFNSAYDSPSKYPHPGEIFTTKPNNWSDKEWKKYKKEHNL